jgi:hypothetical protein
LNPLFLAQPLGLNQTKKKKKMRETSFDHYNRPDLVFNFRLDQQKGGKSDKKKKQREREKLALTITTE